MNNFMPKVTIVIPVYNGTNYMKDAIDSALNQTYKNIEVIVVNDGSTDETEKIALSYGNKIRYYSKENGGVSSALNVGIQHMSGQYFQYLPHDDVLMPTKIEKQICAIGQSGDVHSICWTDWRKLLENGEIIEPERILEFEDGENRQIDVYPLLVNILNTVTVLLHKDYFEKIGVFDISLATSQDYDMWYRTFKNQKTIYIPEDLVRYRWHETQGTQADPEFVNNCIRLSREYVSKIDEKQICKIFGNKYMFHYTMLYYYRLADWKEDYDTMLTLFDKDDEPKHGAKSRMELRKKLVGEQNKDIVLYGAGKNATRLITLLRERGIEPDFLIDRDEKKVGKNICGVKCTSLPNINKNNSVVIVTVDNPEKIQEQLKEYGFQRIISFKDWGAFIFKTIPSKASIKLGRSEKGE